MRTRRTPLLVVLLLAAAPAGLAAGRIEETHELATDGTVAIELIAGSIRIETWDRAELRVSGTYGDDVERVAVDVTGRRATIEVEPREARRLHDVSAELEIRLPAGARIEIETVSADVRVAGARGPVRIESVDGRIEVVDATGELALASVSGPLTVAATRGLREVRLETVSGTIDLAGPLDPAGELAIGSVSGDIRLQLPADVSARFEVETFSGTIVNAFGQAPKRASPYLPSQTLEFSAGAGGAAVTIESLSGRIEIQRK